MTDEAEPTLSWAEEKLIKDKDTLFNEIESIRAGEKSELHFAVDCLSDDELSSAFEKISQLDNLICLDLDEWRGADSPIQFDSRIYDLKNLLTLRIGATIEVLPEGISKLSSLTELWLSSPSIEAFPNEIFALKGLKRLKIRMEQDHDGMPFEAEDEEYELGNLSDLEELDISENSDLYCLPKSIIKCKKLKIVNLFNSGMSEKFPDGFIDLPLTSLDLRSSGALQWLTKEFRTKPGLNIIQ